MKLAEALTMRADLQRKIAQLKDRIIRNAKVQDGEEPAEEPIELYSELEAKVTELEAFTVRINRTNSATNFDSNRTLTEVLARRDSIAFKRDVLFELAKSATVTQDRYRALEIKFRGSVSVKETQKRADALAKEYRQLDLKIQEVNWITELLD